MPPIIIRALGARGVDVDTDPLQLDDASLIDSQNAFQETSNARTSAIRTRRGFTPFAVQPFGGPILGGLGMAVKGAARATGAGGGPGTGGTGPGNGGPPGSSGPTGSVPFPTGGFPTGSGGTFGGARIITIGRSSGASATRFGTSWFVTSENANDAAIINNGPPGPPSGFRHALSGGPTGASAIHGARAGTVFNGYLYYHSDGNLTGALQNASVRRTNGHVDELVASLPHDETGGRIYQIVSFLNAEVTGTTDFIWFTATSNLGVLPTGSQIMSRLYRLDPAKKELTVCSVTGSSGATGYVLDSLANFNGRIFIGEYTNTVSGTANIIPVVPTESGAIQDTALGALSFGPPERNITSLCAYDAVLYAGTGLVTSGAFAHVYQLSLTSSGAWTSTPVLTGAGGTGAANNSFPSMIEFQSKLYASYFNPITATGTSVIYQFDGTTWTGVFTSSGAAQRVPYYLFVDKNILYAVGAPDDITTGAHRILVTADGISWSDNTTGVAAPQAGILSFPLLFGFDQS